MADHPNEAIDYLASGARTTTTNGPETSNLWHKGAHVIINVTAITAAPSLVVRIQGQDPVSNGWYDVLLATAITATGMTVLKVGPGLTPLAGGATSDWMPPVWRVTITAGNADSATYSVGVYLIG